MPGNAGDEDRGHEHRAQHECNRDQGFPDLVHALVGRRARIESGLDIALNVLHHDDRIVDHNADREHQPEQGKIVQREAEHRHEKERADQRDRNGDDGNDRRAPRLQEQNHDEHDENDRLQDRFRDSVNGLLDELGRIIDDGVFEAGRKTTRQLLHRVDDVFRRGERVRARPLEDAQRHRGIAVEIRIGRVVLCRQFDASHVAQPHHGARGLLDDDVVELVGIGETPQRLHRDLKRALTGDRRLIEHTGGDLDVLALERQNHVSCGQAHRLQAVGIDPDAHRVIAAAEDGDRANPVNAGENVGDRERRVIRDEQRIARVVGRVEVDHHHQIGRLFGHSHPDVAHLARQARLRDGNPVLHLHLRDIEAGAELEAHVDGKAPVRRRIRGHVDHVLDAVDLLLDRRDHGRGDDIRIGAGILAGDVDGGRSDLRILRHRQARIRHPADDQEDD